MSEIGKPGALLPKRHLKCCVDSEEAQLRLDQFLPRVFPEFSREFWKKAIVTGSVHLDGRRMSQCSRPVSTGQGVEVFLDGLPLEKWVLTSQHILFQDDYLLALNKPAGIDTQPTPSRYQRTLYQGVLDYLGRCKRRGQKADIGMVQRLDRDTSGVLVFSIHQRAHRAISQQLQQHRAGKTYLAMVDGELAEPQGEFRSDLARIRATNLVRSVPRGGKAALTRFRKICSHDNISLVEVELVTGRMHQIRAHFAEAGHPLCGDHRYGGPKAVCGQPVDRQMLHSWKLHLDHPVLKNTLHLEAPLPADWPGLLNRCGFPQKVLADLKSCC